MRIRALLLGVIISLAFLLAMINLLTRPAEIALSAAPPNKEAILDGAEGVYEINLDNTGHFWISDFDANNIWQVNAATGVYTVFQGIQSPSDARRDRAGKVWWADGDAARFGRLDPATGESAWWQVTGATGLYGTQIDENGNFWTTAISNPRLYRFNADTRYLCSYRLPLNGEADYPLAYEGYIWLGDRANGAILRLDPVFGEYTVWALPEGSSPEGMVFENIGSLWWADQGRGLLSHLFIENGRLDDYDLPTGFLPIMVTLVQNHVWYSELWDGAIGRLDTTAISPTTVTVSQSITQTSFTCGQISPISTMTTTHINGRLSWKNTNYPLLVDNAGWQVYDLPSNAFPWGIATGPTDIYYVDAGRGVIGRMQDEQPATVTACKLEDADGDPGTTGDQSPIEDWPIFLTIDGIRQEPPQLTAGDGCTSWSDLSPGFIYGVSENVPEGWTALTPADHDFGPAGSGGVYQHTFVNNQLAAVAACKLEDADGDLGTTGDQTPIEDWPIFLTIDGIRQEPPQLTAVDGCTSWSDLAPGPTYGVSEDVPEGWTALTLADHDFGPAGSGGVYQHTFVNSQLAAMAACKLEDADGDLGTTGDQTPIEDWPIFLTIDGIRQEPPQLTAGDGCTSWSDLAPGLTYGVSENVPVGWTALTPAEHDFGPAGSGGAYEHTFVNSRLAAVTACKLEDADGDLGTSNDQTPVEDWPVFLTIDGIRQEPPQLTAGDGCTSWSDLAPGLTYGVSEDVPEGWTALTLADHDFGPAGSGDSFHYTFINTYAVDAYLLFLPSIIR